MRVCTVIELANHLVVHGAPMVDESGSEIEPVAVVPASVVAALVDRGPVLEHGFVVENDDQTTALLLQPGVPAFDPDTDDPKTDYWARGAIVVEAIRAAVRRAWRPGHPGRAGVRDLRRLANWMPGVFMRMPEVHERLDALPTNEARRFYDGTGSGGRPDDPTGPLNRAYLVERTMRAHGCTARAACARIRASNLKVTVSADTMRNEHSRYRELVLARARGYLVSETLLVPLAWTRRFEGDHRIYSVTTSPLKKERT